MADHEFHDLLRQLNRYLEAPKQFLENPSRINDVRTAFTYANTLFPDARIELRDDPLQLGALILHIEMFDANISGDKEIRAFIEIIHNADNFEIYATPVHGICFSAVYQDAYIRIT